MNVDVFTSNPEKIPQDMNDPAMKKIFRNFKESRNAEIKILPMMSPIEIEMMANETSPIVRPMSFMKLAYVEWLQNDEDLKQIIYNWVKIYPNSGPMGPDKFLGKVTWKVVKNFASRHYTFR